MRSLALQLHMALQGLQALPRAEPLYAPGSLAPGNRWFREHRSSEV